MILGGSWYLSRNIFRVQLCHIHSVQSNEKTDCQKKSLTDISTACQFKTIISLVLVMIVRNICSTKEVKLQ